MSALLNAGFAALQRGDLAMARSSFDQAAREGLEAHDHAAAFNALTNLAMVNKLGGDLKAAYAAITTALKLEVVPEQRLFACITKASILDALDHINAIAAWAECVTLTQDPPQVAFFLAHAAGGLMKHGDLGAVVQVTKAIEYAPQATKGQLAGIVGAAGESAGKNGVALLAQSVIVSRRHPEAWNASTSPYWELLVERVGTETPLALALVSFGMLATAMQKASSDHAMLMSRVHAMLARVSRARGASIDAVLDLVQRDPTLFLEVESKLAAIVPGDQWVLPTASATGN